MQASAALSCALACLVPCLEGCYSNCDEEQSYILISKKRVSLSVALTFNGVKVPWCSQAKYLGVIIIIHNKFIFPDGPTWAM
jgi:hypothetical protein